MIKLYEMLHSPYCIPIALLLRNSGHNYESIEIPNWDRSKVIEVTNGAYYQVPVLADGSEIIYEDTDTSLNVATYVNDKFWPLELFPDNISGIHEVLIRYIEDDLESYGFKLGDIYYVDGIQNISDRLHFIRHKERRFGRGCIDLWGKNAETLRAEFLNELDQFKGSLTNNQFLFGENPVYADYSLFGIIGNYNYFTQNQLREDQSWLCDWIGRLENYKL